MDKPGKQQQPRGRRFSQESKTRAVQQVLRQKAGNVREWTAITDVAGQTGCAAETLRRWLRYSEGKTVPLHTPLGPGTGRGKGNRFSQQSKEQAMREVCELQKSRDNCRSEWAAIVQVAAATGCKPESLRRWLRKAQRQDSE